MKSIILNKNKIYPNIIAYESSNSFGDQIIEIIQEKENGEKVSLYYDINMENNHVPFIYKEMKKLLDKVSKQ